MWASTLKTRKTSDSVFSDDFDLCEHFRGTRNASDIGRSSPIYRSFSYIRERRKNLNGNFPSSNWSKRANKILNATNFETPLISIEDMLTTKPVSFEGCKRDFKILSEN